MAFTINNNDNIDHGTAIFDADLWVPSRSGFTHSNFILDGSALRPPTVQTEPKITAFGNFKLRYFEIRKVSTFYDGEPYSHTEGMFLGHCRDGLFEYGYVHHIDANTGTLFLSGFDWGGLGNAPCANLTFRCFRFGVLGFNGDGQVLVPPGPVDSCKSFDYNNASGNHTNIQFIDCQVHEAADGTVLRNGAWPGVTFTYAGSSTGGGNGTGIRRVTAAEIAATGWPAFPDGTQGPPHVFSDAGQAGGSQQLAGIANGAGVLLGAARVNYSIAGLVQAQATLAAILSSTAPSGNANGVGTLSGALTVAHPLAGTANGAATVTADLGSTGATPVLLGTRTQSSATGVIPITVATQVEVGSVVVAAFNAGNIATSLSSCVDSDGIDVYTEVLDASFSGTQTPWTLAVAATPVGNAIEANDVITGTTASAAFAARAGIAIACPNTSGTAFGTASASGITFPQSQPTTISLNLPAGRWLVVGLCGTVTGGPAISPPAGWTEMAEVGGMSLQTQVIELAVTTNVTFQPTLASASYWASFMTAFAVTTGGVQQQMAGTAVGAATVTASLNYSHQLTGAVAAAGTLVGAPTVLARLAGLATGPGIMSGALTQAHAPSAAVAGIGTATGALSELLVLAGSAVGAGSATGALSVAATATGSSAYWTTLYGPSQAVFAQLITALTSGQTATLLAWVTSPGATPSYVEVSYREAGASSVIEVVEAIAGSRSLLASTTPGATLMGAGDQLEVLIGEDGAVQVWIQGFSSRALALTATALQPAPAASRIGLGGSTGVTWDNFGGGDYVRGRMSGATSVLRGLATGGAAGVASVVAAVAVAHPLAGVVSGSSVFASTSLVANRLIAAAIAGDSLLSAATIGLLKTLTATAALGDSSASGTLSPRLGLDGIALGDGLLSTTMTPTRPLAGSAAGTGVLSGSLPVNQTLQAAAVGLGSASGALTVSQTISAAVAGAGSLVGALGVALPLAGSAAGSSSTAAVISGFGDLRADMNGSSAMSAPGIPLLVGLTGTGAGSSSSSAALSTTATLQAVAAGASALSGTLTAVVGLQAVTAGTGALSAAPTTVEALSGASIGTSQLLGSLDRFIFMLADLPNAATVAAILQVAHPLAGQAQGEETPAPVDLRMAWALAAAASGLGASAGAVTVAHPLAGAAAGTSACSGALSVVAVHGLDGQPAGQGSLTGTLGNRVDLAAVVNSSSTAQGSMINAVRMTAVINGAATTNVTCRLILPLAATAHGLSSLTVDGEGSISLISSGQAGAASVTASLGLALPLTGGAWVGTSSASGSLTRGQPLAASMAGVSTATVAMVKTISLRGSMAGYGRLVYNNLEGAAHGVGLCRGTLSRHGIRHHHGVVVQPVDPGCVVEPD